jgi:hypothetical protein
MRTNLRFSFGLISLLLFNSCDPIFNTQINNKSNHDILLIIHYDRNDLESIWSGRPFIPYLKSYANERVEFLINIDTINLISKFNIKPNKIFRLKRAIGEKATFSTYQKIEVISKNDTLVIDSQAKLDKAFKEIETRSYELEIK